MEGRQPQPANILNKQPGTANKGWSSYLGNEQGTNNSSPQKKQLVTKCYTRSWTLGRPRQWKMDIRFEHEMVQVSIGKVQ
jgi:hypothetical protein